MEFIDFTNIVQMLIEFITDDPYYTYYWLALIIGGVFFLAFYALEAFALFTIAKRNGYKNRWMAFVPFLNTYYIGVLADKNKTFKTKTKYFAIPMAVLEFLNVAIFVLSSVAIVSLFSTTYVKAVPESIYSSNGELILTVFTGKYEINGELPSSLYWAWWVFSNISSLSSVFELLYLVFAVFVLSAFFRTYSPKNYFVFTIFSVILPIKAIFMLCVRDNNAISYTDYMKEVQRKRYNAYQEYMRNNGGYGHFNGGNYNSGNYGNNGYNNNGSYQQNEPQDPFGGLGENSGANKTKDEDPFEDLK